MYCETTCEVSWVADFEAVFVALWPLTWVCSIRIVGIWLESIFEKLIVVRRCACGRRPVFGETKLEPCNISFHDDSTNCISFNIICSLFACAINSVVSGVRICTLAFCSLSCRLANIVSGMVIHSSNDFIVQSKPVLQLKRVSATVVFIGILPESSASITLFERHVDKQVWSWVVAKVRTTHTISSSLLVERKPFRTVGYL